MISDKEITSYFFCISSFKYIQCAGWILSHNPLEKDKYIYIYKKQVSRNHIFCFWWFIHVCCCCCSSLILSPGDEYLRLLLKCEMCLCIISWYICIINKWMYRDWRSPLSRCMANCVIMPSEASPPKPPPSPPLHPTPVASVFDFSIFKSACQSFLCHPLILSSHHAWLTAVPPPCWEIIMNILWILPTFPKSPSIFFKRGLCGVPQEASALHGRHEEKKKPVGMAYSPGRAHLRGDNLMDVVDSAFSIHNLYGILSSKVQMHNECLS